MFTFLKFEKSCVYSTNMETYWGGEDEARREYGEFSEQEPDMIDYDELLDWWADDSSWRWNEEIIADCADIWGLKGRDDVMIAGQLGLWHGTRTIKPETGEYTELIRRAVEDCEDVDIYMIDQNDEMAIKFGITSVDDEHAVMLIEGHHHDGTNIFVLGVEKKKGDE